jgi:lipopolysaccharide transport system permease protein
MVPWMFFISSTNDMVDSLVGNMNLISKIYFRREVLPIAVMLARFVDFLIACLLLVPLLIIYKVPVYIEGWSVIPILLFLQILISLGLGLIGSALNVFYRDIRHIFVLGLQLWFYATPILYPISSVPSKFLPIYYLNPMAGIITSYRLIIFEKSFPGIYIIYSAIFAILIFLVGIWFFKKVEYQFADVI